MSEQTTETNEVPDPYQDPNYFGPSKEQLEARGEPDPLPESIERSLQGEAITIESKPYVWEGGTPENPSNFPNVEVVEGEVVVREPDELSNPDEDEVDDSDDSAGDVQHTKE